MPNYFKKEIAAFLVANEKDSRGERKTPKKRPPFSSTYWVTVEGKKCDKFVYGHCVADDGRVYLRKSEDDESPKLTLANDLKPDHELAKSRLIHWLATDENEGRIALQVFRENAPTSNRKRKSITTVVKKGLAALFDVSRDFIEDETAGPWDLVKFHSTTLAYSTAFLGDGT